MAATREERLTAHEKGTPFTECVECGNKTLNTVRDDAEQLTQVCAKCGHQHVVGRFGSFGIPKARSKRGD